MIPRPLHRSAAGHVASERRLVNSREILLGFVVLLLGSLVYLFIRPAAGLPFLPDYFPQLSSSPPIASNLAQFFPAFAHTLGFGLLTAGVLATGPLGLAASVTAWALINLGFELGQHPSVSLWIVGHLTSEPGANRLMDSVRCYFQQGTWDLGDVWAILAGVGVGYLVALGTQGSRQP